MSAAAGAAAGDRSMVTWSGVAAAAAASEEEEVRIELVLGLFARSALRCGYIMGARWWRSEVSFASGSVREERESCGLWWAKYPSGGTRYRPKS